MTDIKLAWEPFGKTYEARMNFNIPGCPFDHTHSKMIIQQPAECRATGKGTEVVFRDEWTCYFYFELKKDGYTCLASLTNKDFNISNTMTAEEMMQAMSKLTPEDIADALAADGWEPDAE